MNAFVRWKSLAWSLALLGLWSLGPVLTWGADPATTSQALNSPLEAPKPKVEVMILIPQTIMGTNRYPGFLIPEERVTLSTQSEGIVEALHFEVGEEVKKGQLMAQIALKELSTRREIAESNLKQAEASFRRDSELRAKGTLTETQMESTRQAWEITNNAFRLAELALFQATITSPINGTIKAKTIKVGEFIQKGQPIAEILNLEQVRVQIAVPETDLRYIPRDKAVAIKLDAIPDETFPGRVKLIGLEAHSPTRTFPVEIQVNNPRRDLRPGMQAHVLIEMGTSHNQIVVPRVAIVDRPEGPTAFIEEAGIAKARLVKLGTLQEEQFQVLQGLQPGEHLIVKGQEILLSETPVQVQAPDSSP